MWIGNESATFGFRRWRRTASTGAVLLVAMFALAGARPAPQDLPFGAGERLTYRMSLGRFGEIGRGSIAVEGPRQIRNRDALVLRFDFQSRIGIVRVSNHTESWIDPYQMASLRFVKRERHPLSSSTQSVELYPEEGRWESADGKSGTSENAPLDELSFLFFVRTLELENGAVYRFNRHFEAGRNPVEVRVLRRETTVVPAGSFPTVVVEMRVQDPDRFRGSGVIRLFLTDDDVRMPVRIETPLSTFGTMVLRLESSERPANDSIGVLSRNTNR